MEEEFVWRRLGCAGGEYTRAGVYAAGGDADFIGAWRGVHSGGGETIESICWWSVAVFTISRSRKRSNDFSRSVKKRLKSPLQSLSVKY